jgi:phosphoribosylaminoimidazole carboxylase (NCAIR synthetase)
MGSTTELVDMFTRDSHVLNQLKLAKNSSSKIRMKERFKEAGVNTASWIRANTPEAIIEGMSQFSESAVYLIQL